MRTRLFQILRYFELNIISLGFAFQSFSIAYFELFFISPEDSKWRDSTVWIFRFFRGLKLAGFNCITCSTPVYLIYNNH